MNVQVELWSDDGGKLYETLALCNSLVWANLVYDAAIMGPANGVYMLRNRSRVVRRSDRKE